MVNSAESSSVCALQLQAIEALERKRIPYYTLVAFVCLPRARLTCPLGAEEQSLSGRLCRTHTASRRWVFARLQTNPIGQASAARVLTVRDGTCSYMSPSGLRKRAGGRPTFFIFALAFCSLRVAGRSCSLSPSAIGGFASWSVRSAGLFLQDGQGHRHMQQQQPLTVCPMYFPDVVAEERWIGALVVASTNSYGRERSGELTNFRVSPLA